MPEYACPTKWTSTGEKDWSIGYGTGATQAKANRAATKDAEAVADRDAGHVEHKHTCKAGCDEDYRVTKSKHKIIDRDKIKPGLFRATALVRWTLSIRCVPKKGGGKKRRRK
jgi:hypothetical protein